MQPYQAKLGVGSISADHPQTKLNWKSLPSAIDWYNNLWSFIMNLRTFHIPTGNIIYSQYRRAISLYKIPVSIMLFPRFFDILLWIPSAAEKREFQLNGGYVLNTPLSISLKFGGVVTMRNRNLGLYSGIL